MLKGRKKRKEEGKDIQERKKERKERKRERLLVYCKEEGMEKVLEGRKIIQEARKKESLLVCKQEEIKVGRKKKHSRRKESKEGKMSPAVWEQNEREISSRDFWKSGIKRTSCFSFDEGRENPKDLDLKCWQKAWEHKCVRAGDDVNKTSEGGLV